MRVLEIRAQFGLDNLQFTEREVGEPGPGEVLLEMKAASLNFRDLLTIQGFYNPRQPLPLIPCSDGVGEVIALGEGVNSEMMGKRVLPLFAQRWLSGEPTKEKLMSTLGGPLDGVLREKMILSAESLVEVPDYLSDEEAACLPCAALTAWSALIAQGGVKAGDEVLTLGTGGVSLFALQFAKMAGAKVIITSSSDEKLHRAIELGADEVINYRKDAKWGKVVKERTDGRGVDHVIEVGGAGTLAQSLRAVRIGGTISLIGVLSGGLQEINVIPILMQNIRVQGVIVGHKEMFEDMNRAMEVHKIRPVVDQVFSLDEVPEAFDRMAEGAHFGKICVRIKD